MTATLVSFASSTWAKTRRRFCKQAHSVKAFDKIRVYSEMSEPINIESSHSRGHGFYQWKSQAVYDASTAMQDGEILVWADVGCSFNPVSQGRLFEYFKMARKDNAVVFKTYHMEDNYTKRDLFEELGCTSDAYTQTPQIAATVFVLCINTTTRAFIYDWMKHCTLSNIDDTIVIKSPKLRQHRCDQSVFSLLCKKYAFKSIRDETQVWDPLRMFYSRPILATRIRGP